MRAKNHLVQCVADGALCTRIDDHTFCARTSEIMLSKKSVQNVENGR